MKRLLVVLALLCAGSTYAQDLQLLTATTAPLNLYVSTTGLDANPCTVAALPCLTINGAIAKVPHIIRNPVTINLASGTYTGAGPWVEGFAFNNTANLGAWLSLQGTLVAATPATGLSSGTTTGGTKGVINTGTLSTAVQTGAGWTSDDFKGKLLLFTSGALSGAAAKYYPIVTNTSDTITFTDIPSGAPAVGVTFQVYDWGTILNTKVAAVYASPGGITSPYFPAMEIAFTGGTYQNVTLQNLRFAITTGNSGVRIDGASVVYMVDCKVDGSANNGAFRISGGVKLSIADSVFQNTPNTPVVQVMENDNNHVQTTALASSLLASGIYVYGNGGVQHGYVARGDNLKAYVQNSYFKDLTKGFFLGTGTTLESIQNFFDNTAYGISVSDADATPGLSYVSSFGDYFLNNGTAAIRVQGPNRIEFDTLSATAGAGNALGVQVTDGAVAHITSATAVGCTSSSNEITVDGTSESYATLRGATPAVLLDARTGARVYQ